MAYLRGIGMLSAHGAGVEALWEGLRASRAPASEPTTDRWPVPPNGRSLGFYLDDLREKTVCLTLARRLERAFQEAQGELSAAEKKEVAERALFVFASTKGCLEDFVWDPRARAATSAIDPFTPVLAEFFALASIQPRRFFTVSNACASAHSALHVAREELAYGATDWAVVLAADFLGPFVLQGFHALHALTSTSMRPFAADRDGLLLGEAAGAAILSRAPPAAGRALQLRSSAVDCEGFAATRPSEAGSSLERAIRGALAGGAVGPSFSPGRAGQIAEGRTPPKAVIAHGTATLANDSAESRALAATVPGAWISGTKGSVGHTLGAAGLVDLAAATSVLRARSLFPLAGSERADPGLSGRILSQEAWRDARPSPGASVLVTALGFGGVHSAFLLEDQECG